MDSKKIQNILFVSLLGVVTLAFLYLLTPFFTPLFWAAVIAGIFQPLYKRLHARMKRPNLSATIMLFIICLSIILPACVVASILVSESRQIYDAVSSNSSSIEKKIQDALNALGSSFHTNKFNLDAQFVMKNFGDALKNVADYIFVHLTSLTQNMLVFLIQFGVMIYTLFFFFRDGERILHRIMRMCMLESGRGKFLYDKFITTARATLKATVLLGGLQGVSGGLLFFIMGIEGAVIWGMLMVVLAILPGIGCSIIWAPAGVVMLLSGHVWEGITILLFGILVISIGDNLLRPMLIGSDVELHPLLIFLSTLGGLVIFGLSGFVIGPIIASLFLAIWEMFEKSRSEAPSAE